MNRVACYTCVVLVAACGRPQLGAFAERLSPPVISSTSAIAREQSIILTSANSAEIYYTVDGSTPTHASATYSGPIAIPSASRVTVRAFAAAPGYADSAIASATYSAKMVVLSGISPASATPAAASALDDAPTTLTINAGNPIMLDSNTANQSFTITNTGTADWDGTDSGALSLDPALDGVTTDFSDCTGSVLPAGASCVVLFSASSADVGFASTLSAAANASAVSLTVQTITSLLDVQGVVLTQSSDDEQKYLVLTNFSTTDSITIDSAAFDHGSDDIQDVQITIAAGTVLAPGDVLSVAVTAGADLAGSDTFSITYTPDGEAQNTVSASVSYDPEAV